MEKVLLFTANVRKRFKKKIKKAPDIYLSITFPSFAVSVRHQVGCFTFFE